MRADVLCEGNWEGVLVGSRNKTEFKNDSNTPHVAAFEADLKSVDRRINTLLFLSLGLFLFLSYLYDRSSFKTHQVDLFLIFVLGSLLLGLIIATVKAKSRVCEKYGLICPHCGKTPYALFAVTAMQTGICPRCKKDMRTPSTN